MNLLPNWVLTDNNPSIFDTESLTVIEQTARVYKAMQTLIEEYNVFADNVNKSVKDFTVSSEKEFNIFRVALRQEFQDFIDTIDLKVLSQDKKLNEVLKDTLFSMIEEMRTSGEFSEDILSVFDDIVSTIAVEKNQRVQNDNAINELLELLETRLNNLSTLEEGSTTGDAELIDARTDFNGVVHTNLGEHIRTMTRQLSNEIAYTNKDLTELSIRLSDIDGEFITHFIHGNMGIDENGLLYYEYESKSAMERIITPENERVYLKSGDVVKLSDYTDLAINIFYEVEGVWQYATKTSGSYTVTNNGNHCFMILPTNNEITDVSILAKKLVIERNSNLQDNISTSFELYGKPSNYIRNVKILSNEYKHLIITNIRNNYDTQGTGFALYESNENGEPLNVLLNVSNLETKTFYNGMFGDSSKIFLDFDVTQLGEGKRISTSGEQHLIKQSCIFNYKDTVDYLSLSTFEKFGVIGDSFASGEIYVGDYGKDYYNLSWGQILARMTGTSCVNFSKGGLNTRTWLTSEIGLSLMKETEPQNLYWLMLGINDVGKLGANYLGTIEDITEDYTNNPDTFYGNYARIIEQIKEHAPNSKMILSTMAYKGGLYSSYNNAIKEIASFYGIPCIVQRNDEFLNSAFYWDNMKTNHPTALLYSGMAKAFMRLFNKCAYENMEYFKDYVG